jgi:hypothetical protein
VLWKALVRAGISVKQFAGHLGLRDKPAYAQLAMQAPLNFYRLALLPDQFWDCFCQEWAERRGFLFLDTRKVLVTILPERRVLKIALPETAERRTA